MIPICRRLMDRERFSMPCWPTRRSTPTGCGRDLDNRGAVADRLWVKDCLDPDEEKLRFSK
jgi:hypothetical protein